MKFSMNWLKLFILVTFVAGISAKSAVIQDGIFDVNAPTKKYLNTTEIANYLKNMRDYALQLGFKASIESAGKSYEGRDVQLLRLYTAGGKDKKQVFIDAGIHAREHHGVALALYTINRLITKEGVDSKLFDEYEFLIMPIVNPDGYQYSMDTDIWWRKNRRPVGEGCYGVDPNRNYDVAWQPDELDDTKPCNEDYRGPTPFSEPESRNVRDVLLKNKIMFYFSIHTYGNAIFYPYAHKKEEPTNIHNIRDVANTGCNYAKEQLGVEFECGPIHQLYIVYGGGIDYAYDAGSPYSFAMELGAEQYGFQVPLDKLKSTIDVGWKVLRVMLNKALDLKFDKYYY